jgi:Protein tyrosine and serine/threonine kinase
MAPEVGLNRPYDLSADVYSWSMVFWYIMALEPPMESYTPNMFLESVFKDGCRPAINERWPSSISILMKDAWHKDIRRRPNCQEVMSILGEEILKLNPSIKLVSVENTH